MARVDLSPLQPRSPGPIQQLFGGTPDLLMAMMQRRQRQAEFEADQEAKRQELAFRRDQEARLTGRQEMLDKREDARLQAQETRAQEDRRLKGYEAVGKAKPQDRAFLAQLYGGTMGQATPDYRQDPNDPLSKDIDFLENVQEDESSPLGFSYGVNPEHERRTTAAANTQTMTMPGGQPIALPGQGEEQDFYGRLALTLPDALLQRRLAEARAAGLDPKGTIGHIEDERQRQASERNARIVSGRQERASRIASDRDDERDRRAAQREFQKLKQKALGADRELAGMEADIAASGGIPAGAEGYNLFKGKVERASGGIGLMESGNPGAEISDRTKERLGDRMASGRMGAVIGKGLGYLGIETAASPKTALKKVKAERAAIRAKLQEHARTYGLDPSEANLDGPASPKSLDAEADELLKGIR